VQGTVATVPCKSRSFPAGVQDNYIPEYVGDRPVSLESAGGAQAQDFDPAGMPARPHRVEKQLWGSIYYPQYDLAQKPSKLQIRRNFENATRKEYFGLPVLCYNNRHSTIARFETTTAIRGKQSVLICYSFFHRGYFFVCGSRPYEPAIRWKSLKKQLNVFRLLSVGR
jgi:hypothetical protein